MQIVEAFKTGAISTKGDAERLKLEKVRELRIMKRPASGTARKPAAKQLEAGQYPEQGEEQEQREEQEQHEEEEEEEEEDQEEEQEEEQ